MGALVDIKVPDIGDFTDVEVIEVMVKPGDPVRVDDSLITIESDKASMEVPSTQAGIVKEIRVKIGDKVSEGSPIVVIETAAARRWQLRGSGRAHPRRQARTGTHAIRVKKPAPATAQPARRQSRAAAEEAPTDSKNASSATAKSERSGPAAPESSSETGAESERKPHASPPVRKFARELGVDLTPSRAAD